MRQYLNLLERVMLRGRPEEDRTGVGTWSLHGEQLKFDLQKGFPAVTTKKLWMKGVWVELLWFLSGSTRADFLRKHGVSIWEDWTPEDGDLGPVYGFQWRNWGSWEDPRHTGTDQLKNAVDTLRTDPMSRRILVSAWNPDDLEDMALPPCHYAFQFLPRPVREDDQIGRKGFYPEAKYILDTVVIMRSVDVFLGMPFDIASYATLTHMVARCVGMVPGELTMQFGDVHLYRNHLEQAREQLSRNPSNCTPRLAGLPVMKGGARIEYPWQYELGDLGLVGYDPKPAIKAPIAV